MIASRRVLLAPKGRVPLHFQAFCGRVNKCAAAGSGGRAWSQADDSWPAPRGGAAGYFRDGRATATSLGKSNVLYLLNSSRILEMLAKVGYLPLRFCPKAPLVPLQTPIWATCGSFFTLWGLQIHTQLVPLRGGGHCRSALSHIPH